MIHLWDKEPTDPDHQLYERLCAEGWDEDTTEGYTLESLGKVYYDLFNNGLCNFDVFEGQIEQLEVYAHENGFAYPVIVHVDEYDGYDTVSCDDFDEFARKIIRHLWFKYGPTS